LKVAASSGAPVLQGCGRRLVCAQTTKKSVEEPDWDAIRRLTPELRKTNFLRHRAELAAQALATGEVTEVIDFGRAL
jgi:hypothetical protein